MIGGYLCTPNQKREFSSAGLEHLPYKQRVGGSIPSTPTNKAVKNFLAALLFYSTTLFICLFYRYLLFTALRSSSKLRYFYR